MTNAANSNTIISLKQNSRYTENEEKMQMRLWILFLALCCSWAYAEKMSIEDIEQMRREWSSDEEILAAVARRGIGFAMNRSSYLRLKKNFSVAFLQKLRSLAAKQDERGVRVTERETTGKKRTALLIGNSDYRSMGVLANPKNDAEDMARVLRNLGFDTDVRTDCSLADMRDAVRKFEEKIRGGGVGLFFYAGHGLQIKGVNYLVPVDADIQKEYDVPNQALTANYVLQAMEYAGNDMNMIILDACRNNPLARSFSRSTDRGLAKMDAPKGSMIVFAAQPGATADDGQGRNGAFTEILLKYIATPGLESIGLVRKVGKELDDKTGGKQVPWLHLSANIEEFYFRGASGGERKELKEIPLEEDKPDFALLSVVAVDKSKRRKSAFSAGEKLYAQVRWQVRNAAGAEYMYLGVYGDGINSLRKRFAIREGTFKYNLPVRMTKGGSGSYAVKVTLAIGEETREESVGFTIKSSEPQVQTPRGFRYMGKNSYGRPEYKHQETGMEFVLIPAGSFNMGSSDGGRGEKPIHRVTISKPFLLGKTEVTQQVWQQVMGTTPWRGKSYVKERDDYAATYVSWDDAQKFCDKLGLRLPTEAQWEYVCKAGTETKYYWGDSANGSYMWYKDNAYDKGEKYAHRVGQKKSNAFGLYDMSGNVWEWCLDDKREYNSSAVVDPFGPTNRTYRILRGGSWYVSAANARSALRLLLGRDVRGNDLGFRVSGLFTP